MFIDYAELYFGGNGGPHMDYKELSPMTYTPIFLFACHCRINHFEPFINTQSHCMKWRIHFPLTVNS